MHPRRASTRTIRGMLGAMLWAVFATTLLGLPPPGQGAGTQAAPDFALADILGGKQTLSGYRGKVILLNFWSTACPPCIHEMPSLQSLYSALRDKGFVVVAVTSDIAGERTVKPVVERLRLTFPILLDPTGKITRLYGVSLRPTTYLIDRNGFLVSRIVGARDWMSDDQTASIRPLLPTEFNDRDNRFHDDPSPNGTTRPIQNLARRTGVAR